MSTGIALFALIALTVCGTHAGVFPPNFSWGSATAAYQVEGAYNISRGLSIWDIFSHTPGKTYKGETGDVADDEYHRWQEDIQLMKNMGLQNYRLSTSWNRIFLDGTKKTFNPPGIKHYDTLISALVDSKIEPFLTLYHWDLPQHIYEITDGGWTNRSIVDYFVDYAETMFTLYGDRVKRWITFNEPLTFCGQGYESGTMAPGHCSDRTKCKRGNSVTEPYLCAHHVLLAHAKTVQLYREKFQKKQGGIIGITLNCDWAYPFTPGLKADEEAADRHVEFQVSWYADPIFFGNYPESMIKLAGENLPKFTEEEKALLKGSHDYFGLNHYTSVYAQNPTTPPTQKGWNYDQLANVGYVNNKGKLIGPVADSFWLHVVPEGIEHMLVWLKERYDSPPIFITENGVDVPGEGAMPLAQALNDTFRINFYRDYLHHVGNAIQQGVDVRGYFAWSLLDNFEWADGYSKRFGLYYVQYDNDLKRIPKESSKWFSNFIKSNP